MKRLAGYFFQGLLIIVPLTVTLYVFYVTFSFLDGLLPFDYPGIGALIILASITFVGIIGKFFINNPFVRFIDGLMEKAPLVKVLYSSIKDFLLAFVGKEKKFNNPVLVKLNKDNDIERIGFITEENLKDIGINKSKVAVYFPSSYGILGELYIVPKENITKINEPPAEVMKFIVSGGVSK
jgi:uncharacterized membrane protein